MNKTETIVLIPNTSKNIEHDKLISMLHRLTSGGCRVYTLPEFAPYLSFTGDLVTVTDDRKDLSGMDAALVLGGDGSIIEASHMLLGENIPILGINFGHVGFLAEIEMSEMHLLDALIDGSYGIDERMMLDAAVTDAGGRVRGTFTVLNDVVLTNGPVARLIKFDVYCDDVKVETCRADGMIASTPTGSTAYSLSAGGPVLYPSLEGICLTPICPHTLNSRPIIFHGASVIRLTNFSTNNAAVYLNADGRDDIRIEEGDTVDIRRSPYRTRLIRIKKGGFLGALHTKLSEK